MKNGTELIVDRMADFAKEIMELRDTSPKHIQEALRNNHLRSMGLMDGNYQEIKTPKRITYKSDMLQSFIEVINCRERLNDIPRMKISYDKRKKEDFVHNRYNHKCKILHHKYEELYTGLYMIHQRLKTACGEIKNEYNKDKSNGQLMEISQKAHAHVQYLDKAFSKVAELRGAHTHAKLLKKNRILEMEKIASYITLEVTGRKCAKIYKKEFMSRRTQVKKDFKKEYKETLRQVDEVIDKVFVSLHSELFPDGKTFVYPSRFDKLKS